MSGTDGAMKISVGGEGIGLNSATKNQDMLNNPNILTGMSHEMRTHMNAIVAFSFLINNRESSSDEREEFSNYIINSCEQLMVLFDNFLDSAIIDSGNSVNDVRRCDINELLNDQLSDFRALVARHEHKSIELILEDKCIKPGNVYIDIHKVSRVIRNLFLNALETTNNGYIRLGYNLDREKVIFYILDSGQGFQKSNSLLSSRDESEFTGNSSDTQAAVSLILAKKLIRLMQGEVWVEKNGVTGTGVYFSLPVKELVSTSGSGKRDIKSRMAI